MAQRVPDLGRRAFLRRAGVLTTAAASPALLGACTRDTAAGDAGTAAADSSPTQTAPAATDAASPTPSVGPPLKVGLLVPTSGVYTLLGVAMRQGFQLYLDANPDAFGGRTIETVEVDEGATTDSGIAAAQRLLNTERVALVVGIVSSAVALAVRDLFDTQRVPLVLANAGANALTGQVASPLIFRTSFSNRQPNFALGQFVHDQVTANGVYLMASDYASGTEQLGGFRQAYEAAGGIVAGERLTPFAQTTDYTPFLAEVAGSGAQALFAFYAGSEAVSFVQQYAESGLAATTPLLGSGFLTDETVLPAQGGAAEGVRTSLHYVADLPNPTNAAFVAAYEDAYGERPTVYSVQAYDAAQLIAAGLQATGGDQAVDGLLGAMSSAQIDSPRGAFRLDANRNPVQMYYLREVRGGANVYVQDLITVEDATAG